MKTMQHIIITLIALPLLFGVTLRAQGQGAYRVEMVVGDVKIISGSATRAAKVEETLGGTETIVTGKGSMADISLGDRGMLSIQENSRVSLLSAKKGSDDADLDLSSGNILVMLSKLVKGETFDVKTRTQVASVRGTSFEISGDEEESQCDVLSGTVMVHPVMEGRVRRDIAERVTEYQSVRLKRGELRDILEKRTRMRVGVMDRDRADRIMKRANRIRESRHFMRMNKNLRMEMDDRMKRHERFRREWRDGGKFPLGRDRKDDNRQDSDKSDKDKSKKDKADRIKRDGGQKRGEGRQPRR